ncbi:hypothetical protein B0A50_07247 [Salinomyces thailandicus]|uniref:Uncharacterized protein n=1 Tax=Salinomyces thailandicus TaxID=706561 RepID=A0A4V5N3C2_9PEZI|nr:hypothetical protein B0A50_07247 [Salinomyces thailandica]
MFSEVTGGMWIWNTSGLLANSTEISELIEAAHAAQISDLYLYMAPSFYTSKTSQIQSFIQSATAAGLRVWALDGDRAYFDDAAGPANFYDGIDHLIAYNDAVDADARFFGFQADNEPQDAGTYTSFHNGVVDSALSNETGSGTWQSTQAQDREMLMRSWLTIHQIAQQKLQANGLSFGAAMPFWTESYEGTQIRVNFPDSGSSRRGVMEFMMALLDEYVVMSYNTDPANAASRVAAQAKYASTLPAGQGRPRVLAAMEVTPGVGVRISYGDTEGKNSKGVVLQDREGILGELSQYEAFGGLAIHQWSAWRSMPE